MFSREEGSTLILAMAFIFVFIIISTVMSNFIVTDLKTSAKDQDKIKVLNLAEAGIEEGIYNYKYYDEPSMIDENLGEGSYEVTFDDDIGNELSRVKSVAYVNRGLKNEVKKELVVDLEVSDSNGGAVVNCEEGKLDTRWTNGDAGNDAEEVDVSVNNTDLPTVNRSAVFSREGIRNATGDAPHEFFDNGWQPKDLATGPPGNRTVDLNRHGDIYLAHGELNLSGVDKMKATKNDPAVILVDGRLKIPESVKLENIYILTTDASKINAPIKTKNFFLHSGSNVEIEGDLTDYRMDLEAVIAAPSGEVQFGVHDNKEGINFKSSAAEHIDLVNNLPTDIFNNYSIRYYEDKLGINSGAPHPEKEVDIISRTEI
ncbi:MAG: hypothetical protein R6V17_04000 [Halanaerobacter sp.]